MLAMDNYFRFKLSRRSLTSTVVTPAKSERINAEKPSVKFIFSVTEEQKPSPSKPCSGFSGAQLGAVRSDGRKYRCNHPKDCTFKHITVAGKSSPKLLEIVSSMPPIIRSDLTKAIDDRK
jgi:hypothetical protein